MCHVCENMTEEQHALHVQILSHGQNEEFHQRQGNGHMFGYHKAQRLKLEAEYRKRFKKC